MTQRVRDTVEDPGIELVVMRNVGGTTLTRGMPVSLDTTSPDGVGVSLVKNGLFLFVGVMYEDVADGLYGRVQKSGFCDYAIFNNVLGAVTIGAPLRASSDGYLVFNPDANSPPPNDASACEAKTTSGTLKVWLGPGC